MHYEASTVSVLGKTTTNPIERNNFLVSFSTMEANSQKKMVMGLILLLFFAFGRSCAWTGEIHGRVVCDICGDSSLGPEDHVLEGLSLSLSLCFPFRLALFFNNTLF